VLGFVLTDPLHVVVGRLYLRVGNDQDMDLVPCLGVANRAAFLIQEVGRDVDGHLRQNAPGLVLHGLLLEDAQDGECE
jgi:hypothetical protein